MQAYAGGTATAILLTDKQHARIFTMKGGEVREWTDFEGFVPHRTAKGGWSQGRYQRRSDNFAQHHVDKAAELTFKLLQHYPFDWLILGAEVQHRDELNSSLHPYLKDRLISEIRVRIDAPASEILARAQELRGQNESKYIDTLIAQVQEYAGAGGRGAIGLHDTLQVLNEQKVHILLVQQGYSHPGSVYRLREPRDVCRVIPGDGTPCPTVAHWAEYRPEGTRCVHASVPWDICGAIPGDGAPCPTPLARPA